MKIKWIGKFDGNNLPSAHIPNNAKAMPEVTNKSTLILIPIFAFIAFLLFCKTRLYGGVMLTRQNLAIGFLVGFFLFPVHELLHAISFPSNSDVFIFFTMQGLGTSCTTPVTKKRFLVVTLLPSILLGVIPLVLFMLIPSAYERVSAILFAISFLQIGGSYVDIVNVFQLLQLPSKTMIQISGSKIYWYPAE